MLYDEEEAEAIQEYCAWILELVNGEIGIAPDEEYHKHPAWPQVIDGALKIRKLMARKNKENKFWHEYYADLDEIHDPDEDLTSVDDKKYLGDEGITIVPTSSS
jgi:hypothetical protein